MERPTTELAIIIVALFSSSGLITLLLRRWWGQQDDASVAYRSGVTEGEKRCTEQLAEVRRQAIEDRIRCDAELAKLRDALVTIMQSPSTDHELRTKVFTVLWPPHEDRRPG